MAAATVNRYLALIRSILRAAKNEWEWIDAIPRVRLLKEPNGRVRWITQEEARRLINELPGHLAAMARFSLSTGLRRSNVTQLRWSEVDMELAQAWVRADDSKTDVAISVPLNSDALAVLREQIGKHDGVRLYLQEWSCQANKYKGLVFRIETGGNHGFSMARFAPHMGIVACAKWHAIARTDGVGRLENLQDSLAICALGKWATTYRGR